MTFKRYKTNHELSYYEYYKDIKLDFNEEQNKLVFTISSLPLLQNTLLLNVK